MKGTLYLIPSPLGDTPVENVIPGETLKALRSLKSFVVEELRSARRYLSAAGFRGEIDTLELHLLNEHSKEPDIEQIVSLILKGESMGVISEAGLPAVADPGAQLVSLAHKSGINVVPLTGPSSLMLALMASGKNGQSFAFAGYLPVRGEERRTRIRELERISLKTGQSQIIIETPYRNDSLVADFLRTCSDGTTLAIACDLTTGNGFVKTKSIAQWKREIPKLNKRPCVFIL